MKKPLIVIIIVLLSSIVGYLALDRHEKNVGLEKDKKFDEKFLKK